MGYPSVEPGHLRQAVEGFEFPHTFPLHGGVPGVVHSVASAGVEQRPHRPGEQGFLLLSGKGFLDVPSQVEGGKVRRDLADLLLLKLGQVVGQHFHPSVGAKGHGFRHPVVPVTVGGITGEVVVPEVLHVILVSAWVEPVEQGERPLVEPQTFLPALAVEDKEFGA